MISAVIPVLNEEPTLRELHRRVRDVLRGLGEDFEVVFVDDGSTDGSAGVLRALSADDPRVVVVELRRRFGKAAALAAGFAEARGDVIATLDADLQDVPEELPKLIARLREGKDLVTGRKEGRKDPWTRRAASRLFNGIVSVALGVPVRDVNSGLKVLRRAVLEEVPLYGELHRFLPVLAAARGFAVDEVPVRHEPRRFGRSRYGWERYTAGLLDPLTVLMLTRYGKRPLHFFGLLGGALAAVGVAILGYLSVLWFMGHGIGTRPLLTLGVLLALVGLQSAFFGLIAELIVVGQGRPDRGYSVRSVLRRERDASQPAPPEPEPTFPMYAPKRRDPGR